MFVKVKFKIFKCTYKDVEGVEAFAANIVVFIHGGTHDGDVSPIDAPHALVDLVMFCKAYSCLMQPWTLNTR